MRVVLVGQKADRNRLRADAIGAGLEIVGEAASLASARAGGFESDAFLVAASVPPDRGAVPDEALTPREVDILQRLALGLPNKAIADRLGISDQTVKFHVASILGKLGAANRTEAVRRAARRGLIDL